MPRRDVSDAHETDAKPPVDYYRPAEVPPDLTPLERALIAARQIRLWADWLLEVGPAPPQTGELTEATEATSDGRP